MRDLCDVASERPHFPEERRRIERNRIAAADLAGLVIGVIRAQAPGEYLEGRSEDGGVFRMRRVRIRRPDVVRIRAAFPATLTGFCPSQSACTALVRVSIVVSLPAGKASQSRAVPSVEAVTIVRPLGSKPTPVTVFSCPTSGARRRPLCPS